MQALGLIETRGLLPAIECADVMLKAAQVELVERTFVGGGLVTIMVTGDVAAVKAAVEAGVAAVEKINRWSLISQHVIARPHYEMENIVAARANTVEEKANINEPLANQGVTDATEVTEPAKIVEESTKPAPTTLVSVHKPELDALVQQFGLEKAVAMLKSLSVAKLRKLAREYKDLGIAGRAISKANKELLIQKLKGYYKHWQQK
ncbi:BMC domain-containing protein [Peptococcaceae bacterium 1198_IL3148]